MLGRLAVVAVLLSGCGENAPPTPGTAPVQLATAAPAGPQAAGSRDGSAQVVSAQPSPGPRGGSAQSLSAGAPDSVVVRVNGRPITSRQLTTPLIESHGLAMLGLLVQLDLAKQSAVKLGVVVSASDIAAERQTTLNKFFADADAKLQAQLDKAIADKKDAEAKRIRAEMESDHEMLIDQFLDQQHIGMGEFDIVLETNTYLHKIAEPQVNEKISESSIENAFKQTYGETVEVRYIELASEQEVGQARARLAAGDKFEDVVRDMSRNRTSAEVGGLLPPFSRETQSVPENFKETAFGLKPGEVSDEVRIGNTFLLIQGIRKIPPRAVKYEDVKASVRKLLHDRLMDFSVKQLREDLARQALKVMEDGIEDPILRNQLRKKQDHQIRDQQRIKQEMDKEQRLKNALKLPTTDPATQGAATQESPARGDRPPATRPGPAASQPLSGSTK